MPRPKSPSKNAASANGDARTNGTATTFNKKNTTSALQTSSAPNSNVAQAGPSRPSPVTDTSSYPSVSEEKIRQRAYELYMQRGGKDGGHVEDWFRAEAELRSHR